MDRIFLTQTEAVREAKAFRAGHHRREAEPWADPTRALWGVWVSPRIWVDDDEDTIRSLGEDATFLWPRFDKPFEAIVEQVTPEEFTQVLLRAEAGSFATRDDVQRQLFQACRYDINRRQAFISEVSLAAVRDAGYLKVWETHGFRYSRERETLGGYAVARAAVYAEITEALCP